MKTTKWRVYSDYSLEEDKIVPKVEEGFLEYDPMDQFHDDQESQPVYIELANIAILRLQQDKYGKVTTTLAEDLVGFTKKYGPLGIGWRYTLLKDLRSLSECTVILDPNVDGLLTSLLDCRLLKSTPALTEDVAMQLGYKLYEYTQDATLAVKISHEPLFIKGADFFSPFYSEKELNNLSPKGSNLWNDYSEKIGELVSPFDSLPILESFSAKSKRVPQLSIDTLGANMSVYAEYFLSVANQTKQRAARHTPFVNLIQPKLRPEVTPTGVKYFCSSLLDACFWMIHLEQQTARRIRQCPWCGRYNRFPENAPSNAEYCPPRAGNKGKSCSARFADLKYKQRNLWNQHLRSLYPDFHKETLSKAWDVDVEALGYWDESVKDPVPHPMDLRAKAPLPEQVRLDFLNWKPNFKRNPKNYLVTDFEWILS